MTFDQANTLPDLLRATQLAAAAHRSEARRIDAVTLMRELGEADAAAQEAGHLDRHQLLGRLSAAAPTALALAEVHNFSSLPAFIRAACRALFCTTPTKTR